MHAKPISTNITWGRVVVHFPKTTVREKWFYTGYGFTVLFRSNPAPPTPRTRSGRIVAAVRRAIPYPVPYCRRRAIIYEHSGLHLHKKA